MNTSQQMMMYKIAKLYYLDNYSQTQISEKLSLSRSKVSRILAQARNLGIVEFKVIKPSVIDLGDLADKLKSKFNIEHLLIVPTDDDVEKTRNKTVQTAASYFAHFLRDGDSVGVSWGSTLLLIAEHFSSLNLPKSKLLQVSGNLDNADSGSYAHEIIHKYSQKLGTKNIYTLTCPAIVENSIIVDLLLHDARINNIMDMVNKVDVIFPDIGILDDSNCLKQSGYLSSQDFDEMINMGSVGNICCHFIDQYGQLINLEVESRTISISLDSIKNARHSCACVYNAKKASALLGCMNAQLVNVLVIDSQSAFALLELKEAQEHYLNIQNKP